MVLAVRGFTPGMPSQPMSPFGNTSFQPGGLFPGVPEIPVGKSTQQNPFMTGNRFAQAGFSPAAVETSQATKDPAWDNSKENVDGAKCDTEMRYTCTICQKTFRLESALIHHMSFKHNQVIAPGSVHPTTGTTPAPGPGGNKATQEETKLHENHDVTKPAGPNDFVSAFSSNSDYAEKIRDAKKESANKLPPEEVTIACHSSCINTVVLVGHMVDIQIGFVWEDRVLQFSIICPFPNPPAGESDRDVVVVRYYLGESREGEKVEKDLRKIVKDGKPVCVIGNLRMNPQVEKVNSKYYYYPLVHVSPSSGSIQVLE